MRIKFLGPVKVPPDSVVAQVEREFSGGTVTQLLGRLGFAEGQAWYLSVIADEARLAPHDEVPADAEVTIMLLVGGG